MMKRRNVQQDAKTGKRTDRRDGQNRGCINAISLVFGMSTNLFEENKDFGCKVHSKRITHPKRSL